MRIFFTLFLFSTLVSCSGSDTKKDVAEFQSESAGLLLETSDSSEGDKARAEAFKEAQSARIEMRLKDYKKEPADLLFERGAEAQSAQNFKDAADAFTAFVVHHPNEKRVGEAVTRAIANRLRMNDINEALFIAEDSLLTIDNELTRVRIRRVLGNAYLSVEHFGSKRGGEVIRGQYVGNQQVNLYRADRLRAIKHLEQAREDAALFLKNKSMTAEEHDALLHDLLSAIVRFTPFDGDWSYWWYAWQASADDDRVEEEGADEQINRWRGYNWRMHQTKPKGLEVTSSGQVVFHKTPPTYSPDLEDTQKIKFLLSELEDKNATRQEAAADALLRRALIFRSRDGVERLDRLRNYYDGGRRPYQEQLEAAELNTLEDNEVMGLVATRLQRYTPPDDENFFVLIQKLIETYPETKSAEHSRFLLGQYFQSRLQYEKAREAYRAHISATPEGAHVSSSKAQLKELDRAQAAMVDTAPQPAGVDAQLNIKFRNLDRVRVKVRPVNRGLILKDFKAQYKNGSNGRNNDIPAPNSFWWWVMNADDARMKRYAPKVSHDFERDLSKDQSGLYRTQAIKTPVQKAGLYVVDILQGETRLSRGLMLLESIAIIKKDDEGGPFVWIVDANKGTPLNNTKVEVFEYWTDYKQNTRTNRSRSSNFVSGKEGIARIKNKTRGYSTVTIAKNKSGVAYSGFYYGWSQHSRGVSNQKVSLVTTDRPVYRPGNEVQIKVWARDKVKGQYRPATSVKNISIRVFDPQGNELKSSNEKAGEFGDAALSLMLKEEAALGLYRVDVRVDGQYANTGGGSFRVEEYKAPEFSVSVKSDDHARLGEVVKATVKADYLFGGAVAGAKVNYKVYRQDHQHSYKVSRAWDWLYGIGYGRCYYHYDWFAWWPDLYPSDIVWYPWWGPKPEAAKELVKEGEARLNEKGELKIDIDTRSAKDELGNTDHRYTIKAEVTDLSRRLIKGEGSILVTKDAYFAHIETERPWTSVGESVTLRVAAQKPDGTLFATKGEILVEKVIFARDEKATISEKVVDTIKVNTDKNAPIRVTYKAVKSGQYKFTFVSKDDQGNKVLAHTVTWIAGSAFRGRAFKFKGVEIHTDKRSYKIGDTAKLLVNANQENASVLLSIRAQKGRLYKPQVVKLKGKVAVVDIKIEEGDVPNIFVEATTVAGAEVHQEMRELFVPPQSSTLKVNIEGQKDEYKPGEEVALRVRTTDENNNPIAADVALSVFDKAVLYIQSNLTPDARAHFWAQKRTHSVNAQSSLQVRLPVNSSLDMPDRNAAYQLRSAHRSRLQRQQNFRYRDGELRGANMLKEDNGFLDAAGEAQGLGGLGARGQGAGGGGGFGKAKKAARKSSSQIAAAPAAEPSMDLDDSSLGAMAKEQAPAERRESKDKNVKQNAEPANKKPTLRKKFADTAHFAKSVRTGKDGLATVSFTLPDNLTTWKAKAIGLDGNARAGQNEVEFKSTKNILVRLQAPRFFRERDRVVLSAIVRNTTKSAQNVKVAIDVSEELSIEGEKEKSIRVPKDGDVRVDFWANVKKEGTARVRMDALSKDESDAKELSFPVLVHGLTKTVSNTGSIAFGKGEAKADITLEIPKERREELSELTLQFSPTLAGAMLEALPYLLEYPYGCTEQTLSRFVPAVLTRKALQQSGGLKLEDLKAMGNLNPQELRKLAPKERDRLEKRFRRFQRSPVFNTKTLDSMISQGTKRLASMQNSDGGFGWWGRDGSSRYTTAHVVDALLDAQSADLRLPNNMLARGKSALAQLLQADLWRYKKYKDWVSNEDAFALYVMSRYGQKNQEMLDHVFKRRQSLSTYGKLLGAMAFKNLGKEARAQTLMQNVEQVLKVDDENQSAWLETNQDGWWYWYNNDIETNALYVRALDLFGQGKNKSAGVRKARSKSVVKWLLNNRKNGRYWNGTRDTARVVAAFANHMQVAKVRNTDADIDILLDGKVIKSVHIDKRNLLTFDGSITLRGDELTSGKHKLTFRRRGEGALYFNSYLSYFTTEEDVKGTGLEIKVERRYYKLVRDDRTLKSQGDRGQTRKAKQVAYRKVALKSGAQLKSGDLVLVELLLNSKNDYTFLAFEDPKPAGFEAVALKSGTTYGEAVANMELRDEKVAFFLRTLPRGKLMLSYRLRAEIPGSFHAMPTHGYGMYAPELDAISDEMRFDVSE